MPNAAFRRFLLAAVLLMAAAPAWAATPPSTCAKTMTRPPPQRPNETVADLLMPGGQPVGQATADPRIRDLPGQDTGARQLFERLTAGGADATPSGFAGLKRKLPGGEVITFNFPSSGDSVPTIELDHPGIPIHRLRFPETCRPDGGGEAGRAVPRSTAA